MTISKRSTKLREAWFGPMALESVAGQFDLTPRGVQKFWEREKFAGRLPANQERPHFSVNTTIAAAVVDDAADLDLELDRQIERSERQYDYGSTEANNIRATADSLAALKAAHPELDRPLEYVVTQGGSFKPLPHPMVAHELWYQPQPSKINSKPEVVA